MKVVDSPALAKFLNNEPGSQAAADALRAGCVSVDLAIVEAGNSLWKRVERKELDKGSAGEAFAALARNPPLLLAYQSELYLPGFGLAVGSKMTLYDALFVALAVEEGVGLVTSDRLQAEAAKELGVDVELV